MLNYSLESQCMITGVLKERFLPNCNVLREKDSITYCELHLSSLSCI